MSRLWDRGEQLDTLVLQYTAGEDYALDERLVSYDLKASAAHAAMLHSIGYLSDTDRAALEKGLADLAISHAAGQWNIQLEDEDCHTAIENRLMILLVKRGAQFTSAGREMTKCLSRCASILKMFLG